MSSRQSRTGRTRERGFTLVEILVVITIIAALIGIVAAIIPQATAANRKVQCQNNLKNIGSILQERAAGKGLGSRGGSAMLLQTYTLGLGIRKGDERVFLCPGDIQSRGQNLDDPEFKKRYDTIDLNRIDPLLISYAGRNRKIHPLRPDKNEKQGWAVDCQGDTGEIGHHQGGVNILYDDSSVVFLDTEALGVGVEDVIKVGPDSTIEELKKYCVTE
ncbi:MAG TPA: type II secretion system protein [Planctomycetota bacterium]|nr:type II secretion system protein [Planctomycetota bacterium]